jgi:hypothetical protein
VVAEHFAPEQPTLGPLSAQPFGTAYRGVRFVSWDSYVDVRGDRFGVPGHLAGQLVVVRIGLDESLRIYSGETLVASHRLLPSS